MHTKQLKNEETRVVPLFSSAIKYLTPAIAGREQSEFLYTNHRYDLVKRLAVACEKCNLERITFHDLRHICGSNLIMQGGTAFAQAVLGHKDVKMTIDTYGHLTPVYLKKQMAQMELTPLYDDALELSKIIENTDDPKTDFDKYLDNVHKLIQTVRKICHKLTPR